MKPRVAGRADGGIWVVRPSPKLLLLRGLSSLVASISQLRSPLSRIAFMSSRWMRERRELSSPCAPNVVVEKKAR